MPWGWIVLIDFKELIKHLEIRAGRGREMNVALLVLILLKHLNFRALGLFPLHFPTIPFTFSRHTYITNQSGL